jgi:hypothetical protein
MRAMTLFAHLPVYYKMINHRIRIKNSIDIRRVVKLSYACSDEIIHEYHAKSHV